MKNNSNLTVRHLAPCLMVAVLAYASPAIAVFPDEPMEFPAGIACTFALKIEGWNGVTSHLKVFDEKDGYVRSIAAGVGYTLRFTNMENGKTFNSKSNGSAGHTTTNTEDGSSTVMLTGHSVLILWPTDIPAGPSTTLYAGRVVYLSDKWSNFERLSESGKKTDICAALL